MINFLITPDISIEKRMDLYAIVNKINESTNTNITAIIPDDYSEFNSIIAEKSPEVVYSNLLNINHFINGLNYFPFARPAKSSMEALLFSSKDREIKSLNDIKKGMSFAIVANKELELITLRLLEAQDLIKDDISFSEYEKPNIVLRKVDGFDNDIGVLSVNEFDNLEEYQKEKFNVLIKSKLGVISNAFLTKKETIKTIGIPFINYLNKIHTLTAYSTIFSNLNWQYGIEIMQEKDGLFLMDVLSTLED